MTPSVGRVVHFSNLGAGQCKAALITEVVDPDTVHLAVLGTNALFFRLMCPYSPDSEAGSWHWPERVD